MPGGLHVVLHVPFKTMKGREYNIPESMYHIPNLSISRCEDEGPATKFLAALRNDDIPEDSIIVVIDDDRPYKSEIFPALKRAALQEDNAVHVMWAKEILGCLGFSFRKSLLMDLLNYAVPEECMWIDDDYLHYYVSAHRAIPVRTVTIPLRPEEENASIWVKSDRPVPEGGRYWHMLQTTPQLNEMYRVPLQQKCTAVLDRLMRRA